MPVKSTSNTGTRTSRTSKPAVQQEEEEEGEGVQYLLSKDGSALIVTIPVEAVLNLSSTGKSYIVATSGGFQSTGVKLKNGTHKGKEVQISFNAFVKK